MQRFARIAGAPLLALALVFALGSAPAAAQEHPNVQLVKALYTAFGKGDAAAILSTVSPDVRWEVVGRQSDCPCMGVRKGKAGVEEFFKILGDIYDFTSFSTREL